MVVVVVVLVGFCSVLDLLSLLEAVFFELEGTYSDVLCSEAKAVDVHSSSHLP